MGGILVFCLEHRGQLLAGAVGNKFPSNRRGRQPNFGNCPERGELSGPVLGFRLGFCRLAGGCSAGRLGSAKVEPGAIAFDRDLGMR